MVEKINSHVLTTKFIIMATYKEVFHLAKLKKYESYLLDHSEMKEPNKEVVPERERYCEVALVQKWLLRVHLIFVTVILANYQPDKAKFYPRIQSLSSKNMGENLLLGLDFIKLDTYEDALLQGVLEALKLI